MPEEHLLFILTQAIEEGTPDMLGLAFQKTTYLSHLSEVLADWTRRHLSDSLLAAPHREDVLKLDALSARLPDSVGASFVLERSMQLRKTLAWKFAARANQKLFTFLSASPKPQGARSEPAARSARGFNHKDFRLFLVYQISLGATLFGVASSFLNSSLTQNSLKVILVCGMGVLTMVLGSLHGIRYARRGMGERMTARAVAFGAGSWQDGFILLVAPVVISGLMMSSWQMAPKLMSGVAVVAALFTFALILTIVWRDFKRTRTASERLMHWMDNRCHLSLVLHAQSPAEAMLWIKQRPGDILPSPSEIRSLGVVMLGGPNQSSTLSCPHGRPLESLFRAPKAEIKALGDVLLAALHQKKGT